MYTILSQYLSPHNEYVKAAYALFWKLNSIDPNSPSQFQIAKKCAIRALAMLLVRPLRKNGIVSSVEYMGDWKNKNFEMVEELLRGDGGIPDGPLTQPTSCGLLRLIGHLEPCIAKFDGSDTAIDFPCSLKRQGHEDWHKSTRPWSGKYSKWSIFWQTVVNLSSALSKVIPFNFPTFWPGIHAGQHDEEHDMGEFWDFFQKSALKGNFLQLHKEILSMALSNFQARDLCIRHLYKLTNPESYDAITYCFMCVVPLSYPTERTLKCNHKFCKTCAEFCVDCPVCGRDK